MTVTFTTTYRETLAPETVAEIDRLVDNSYALDDILVFIDEHSEEEFRDYYEEYVEAGETYGYEAVDYFVNDVDDLANLDKFTYAYIGEFSSPGEMASYFFDDEWNQLDYRICVDWKETAEYLLNHDVDRHGDHYFRCCF
jgi:hypothetical protein